MPKYTYNCGSCGREYIEVRSSEEPLYFSTCPCGTEYTLVSEEPEA